MNAEPARTTTTATRRIVLVLQDLLRANRYDAYADLKADLKARLARLRLPYDAESIALALDRVEHGGDGRVLREDPPDPPQPVAEAPTISRADASRIVMRLLHGQRVPLRSMPEASVDTRTEDDYQAARERAYEMGVDLSREEFLR